MNDAGRHHSRCNAAHAGTAHPDALGKLSSYDKRRGCEVSVESFVLAVKVVPGASRDRVAGRYADGVKVQTSAPPEAGKANAAVTKILAQFLGLKPVQVQLASPPANPRKQFRISGLTPTQLAEKLATLD